MFGDVPQTGRGAYVHSTVAMRFVIFPRVLAATGSAWWFWVLFAAVVAFGIVRFVRASPEQRWGRGPLVSQRSRLFFAAVATVVAIALVWLLLER